MSEQKNYANVSSPNFNCILDSDYKYGMLYTTDYENAELIKITLTEYFQNKS